MFVCQNRWQQRQDVTFIKYAVGDYPCTKVSNNNYGAGLIGNINSIAVFCQPIDDSETLLDGINGNVWLDLVINEQQMKYLIKYIILQDDGD